MIYISVKEHIDHIQQLQILKIQQQHLKFDYRYNELHLKDNYIKGQGYILHSLYILY